MINDFYYRRVAGYVNVPVSAAAAAAGDGATMAAAMKIFWRVDLGESGTSTGTSTC
jgi:hypothetical protein